MIAYNPAEQFQGPGSYGKMNIFASSRILFLHLIIFSLPFLKWEPLGSSYFTPPFVFAYFFIAFALLSFSHSFRWKDIKYYTIPFLILLILNWVMTSIYNFPKSNMAYSEARRLTFCFLIFVGLANELRFRPWLENKFITSFLYGLFLVSIFNFLNIGAVARGSRLAMFGLNPNAMGLLFVLGIFGVIKLLFETRVSSVFRWMLIVFGLLFLVIIVRSGSRSAIVGLAIGISIYLAYFKLPFKKKIPFFVAGGVALMVLLVVLLNTELMRARFEAQAEDQNWGGRIPIWEATLPLVYQNPWFGAGASGYEAHFLTYFNSYHAVHNVYLQVLAYTGLVGLCIFIWMLYRFARGAYAINRVNGSPFYLSVWFTYLVYYFVGGGVLTSMILWVLMGMITGIGGRIKLDELEKGK